MQCFLRKLYRSTHFSTIFSSIYIFFFAFISPAEGQTVAPKGFNVVLVASVSNPTVMAFAPDGRLFVAEQTGALRVIKNGTLLQKPFINLPVNSRGERGLLGIAFDPHFSTNKFIYLYYTDTSGSNNRISRFTANGDVVVPGSEAVVLNLSPLSRAVNHNGGNMLFGKDGKLYVGVGENANPANAQNLDTYLGKILRINPDGSVPDGNPFTTGSEAKKRIWAYGMRNPYTLSLQPGTGKIFVNDVGQDMWEEINDCTTGGKNYGWPLAEGKDSTSRFTNPVYTYAHGEGAGLGCAITGGTFFNPSKTNYPSSYIGKYFFLDYCGRWINMISLTDNKVKRFDFASGVRRYPVGMATGPDGNLYFLSRIVGSVYKITYTKSKVPVIDEQPESITISKGNPASFSVKATGPDTLTYQWRKNGVNIQGANEATFTISSVAYADSGKYSVIVKNSAGSDTSNNAILKVTAPNQTPTATIKTPLKGTTYAAGNKIYFSGIGTDPEDSILPPSAFNWFVLFHHNTHTHPGPDIPAGITSGSFTIPDIGETSSNVYYRLYLVVTDSKGAKDTAFTDIKPRKSTITLNTKPANLQVTLDGQPFTTPLTVTSVEGMIRTIGVVTPQGKYKYSSWSNGGSMTQTFATPVNDTTYTANFYTTITDTLTPVADASVRFGTFSDSNYGAIPFLYSKKSGLADYERQSYLKFDISSFTPKVSSAVLRVYARLNSTEDSTASLNIHNVPNNTWDETAITTNNSPFEDTATIATKSIAGTTSHYYKVDITHLIKNLKKVGANFVTLKLMNSDITLSRVELNSKEALVNKPELVVTYLSLSPKSNAQIVTKNNFNKDPGFSIYPNPAKNSFSISAENYPASGVIELSDIAGRLIRKIVITDKIQQINTGSLKNGVYLLTVKDGGKSITKKLVIDK